MNKKLKRIGILIIIAGAFLHGIPYIYNRSLWVDEASLASSIINRSLTGLCAKPLDYTQSAPVGYLYIVKLLTLLFGHSEFALRFWSLIAFLISLLLLYYIVRPLCRHTIAKMFFVCAYAYLPFYYRYANELKPYMSDIMFILLAIYIYQRYRRGSTGFVPMILSYCIIPWFSFAASFAVGALMIMNVATFILKAVRACRTPVSEAVPTVQMGFLSALLHLLLCGLVLASFLLYYVVWLAGTKQNAGGDVLWSVVFFPLIPKSIEDIRLIGQMISVILGPLANPYLKVFMAVCIVIFLITLIVTGRKLRRSKKALRSTADTAVSAKSIKSIKPEEFFASQYEASDQSAELIDSDDDSEMNGNAIAFPLEEDRELSFRDEFSLFSARRDLFVAIVLTIFLVLLASYLHYYPMMQRHIQFIAVLLLALSAPGLDILLDRLQELAARGNEINDNAAEEKVQQLGDNTAGKKIHRHWIQTVLYCMMGAILTLTVCQGINACRPSQVYLPGQETRQNIEYMNSVIQPEDKIYIYGGAVPAYFFAVDYKVDNSKIIYGQAMENYLYEEAYNFDYTISNEPLIEDTDKIAAYDSVYIVFGNTGQAVESAMVERLQQLGNCELVHEFCYTTLYHFTKAPQN